MSVKTLSLRLFSASYCQRCAGAKSKIKDLVEQLNQQTPDFFINYQEVDVVENIDYAVEMGVLTTPSIVLNGQLIFTSMPSTTTLKQLLQQRDHYV